MRSAFITWFWRGLIALSIPLAFIIAAIWTSSSETLAQHTGLTGVAIVIWLVCGAVVGVFAKLDT